ncbi:MAG: hypothetical protein HYX34_01900 [Actinobacteria bacterium]|nr:hypothetical protein [Actinomycetota bacterium]
MGSSRKLRAGAAAALLVLTSLAALGPGEIAPVGSVSVAPPSAGAWLGAYVEPTTTGPYARRSAVLDHERALGTRLDVVHWFYPWTSTFPTATETWAADGGRRNFISWAPAKTTDVNAGRYDSLIQARARGMAAFRRPVLLQWFGEMDSPTLAARSVNPTAFINAWRRIYFIFRAEGAGNVDFVWCPNAWNFQTGEAQKWYPGDRFVEWTCADGYNWAPKRRGSVWTSFRSVFASFYGWAAARGKPIIVGETGALEDPSQPGRKAQWIRDMASTLATAMPRVKAVVWFDAKEGPRFDPASQYDFRVRTSSGAASAWSAVGRSAYFNR